MLKSAFFRRLTRFFCLTFGDNCENEEDILPYFQRRKWSPTILVSGVGLYICLTKSNFNHMWLLTFMKSIASGLRIANRESNDS